MNPTATELTYAEWSRLRTERSAAIRHNRSARLKGLPLKEVPALPKQPEGIEVMELDGTFLGFFPHTNMDALMADLERLGIDASAVKTTRKPRFRD